MVADALPGITPARRPYPGGTERHYPLVPHVLIIGERRSYYAPPPLVRAETVYDTPTTVRVKLPTGRQETQAHHKVWAVPDDAAWAEIEAAVVAFGDRLTDLANVLRRLGSYPTRLAEAERVARAAGPLCESVARIEDPDATGGTNWGLSTWFVPSLERKPILRHTKKMLTAGGEYPYFFTQDGSFVLADDADWDELQAAHAAAKAAAAAAVALLDQRLGTYEDARDGRHAARVAGVTVAPPPTPAEPAPAATALIVAEPAIDGIVVMTRDEARAAADAIITTVEGLRQQIDRFDQGRGWQALGYDSFRAWAQAEIPDTSIRHVYRLRDAAEIERSLGLPVDSIPERHARELKPLKPEQRAEVLARADARAAEAGRERTAGDIQAAAGRVTHGSQPEAPGEFRGPLAAVAAALRRGDTQAAYTAAREAGHLYDQAMAAVDALVEGRPLNEALATLAGTTPASDGAWQALISRTEQLPGGSLSVANGVGTLYLGGVFVTRTNDKLVLGSIISRAEARAATPPAAELDRARERARALGRDLIPAVTNDDSGRRFYALAPLRPGPHAPPVEQLATWDAVIARLDELEAPPASGGAQALAAMVAEARADLTARAAAVGYTLTWSESGAARFVQTATGIPFGGAKDLDEALKRVESLERQAAPATLTTEEAPAVSPRTGMAHATGDAAYAAAERALAEELRAASPRLKRLLAAIHGDQAPASDDELWDVLTDWLKVCSDRMLEWAVAGEAVPA